MVPAQLITFGAEVRQAKKNNTGTVVKQLSLEKLNKTVEFAPVVLGSVRMSIKTPQQTQSSKTPVFIVFDFANTSHARHGRASLARLE